MNVLLRSAGLWFTVVLLLFAGSATARATELKIGYVDAVKVLDQAPQGKSALKRLEAEFAPRDKKLVELREKIKQLEDDLEKNALVLKESERRSRERDLLTYKRDLNRATQEFREDYNLRRNEELASLQKLVYRTIVEIAKQQHFDLILHEGTVYASDKIDITDLVLRRMRAKMTQK
jgi:outer membrane protein